MSTASERDGSRRSFQSSNTKKGGVDNTASAAPRSRQIRNDYPWRVFIRGLVLLITYTRPLRRTIRQFLSRFLADFSEFLIFMTTSTP